MRLRNQTKRDIANVLGGTGCLAFAAAMGAVLAAHVPLTIGLLVVCFVCAVSAVSIHPE